MGIEKMTMVSIVGEYKQLDKTIDACISCECYHPESTSDIMSGIKGFSNISEENPYSVKLQKLKEIFNYCDITPILSTNSPRIRDGEIDVFLQKLDENLHTVQKHRTDLLSQIDDTTHAIEQLEHFERFEIDLNEVFSCKFIKVRFGRLPVDSLEKLEHYKRHDDLLFVPCSKFENYFWGIYVAPLSSVESIDRIFASLFFERLRIPDSVGTPSEAIEQLKFNLQICKDELKKESHNIETYFERHGEECMQLYSQIKHDAEAFEIRRFASKYHNTFMLVGWIPESETSNFETALSHVAGLELEYDHPERIKRFHPPTKLRNCFLFRPFQFFVSIYGIPNYHEIDPTTFVAITYTLLYGIMFADLGQGIVLAVIGFLMYKLKGMPLGKILIPCGIASAIFGTLFGSVFGYEHLLDPMFHALGFKEKPIEIMESATTLLIVSVAIGVTLVIVAMFVNIASCIKKRKFGLALFGQNGLAGIAFYGSAITFALSIITGFQVNKVLLIILGILLPLLIIYMKEPLSDLIEGHSFKPESIGSFLIESFFELFEVVLSYLSNTLSFLRVGAFVLIHAGMMTTFTALSEIAGGGVAGIIIMIFGNIFVIALEGLLVGIQVLRLEFYEMFSRFYDGDGESFNPIKIRAD